VRTVNKLLAVSGAQSALAACRTRWVVAESMLEGQKPAAACHHLCPDQMQAAALAVSGAQSRHGARHHCRTNHQEPADAGLLATLATALLAVSGA
jgi:hypothetical protein